MSKRVGLTVFAAVAVLVVVQLTMPVSVGYATSGSMAPTIQEGDAYLVLHTGDVEQGDVVTFYSPERGDYVTHRVVGVTDAGFVTKGDANAETDQAVGIPPVPPSAVVGEVFSPLGEPLTVPRVGPILADVQTYSLLLVGLIALVLSYDLLGSDGRSRAQSRDVLHVGDVVSVLLLTSFLACFVVVGASGSGQVATQVVTAEETGAGHTVQVGEPATRTVSIERQTLPFTTLYVDVDGAAVVDRTGGGRTLEMTLRVPPRDRIGLHRVHLRTYAYPRTLPYGVVAGLHDVHWTLATAGTLAPVFLPLTVGYLLFFDGRVPIRRVPSHPDGSAWRG